MKQLNFLPVSSTGVLDLKSGPNLAMSGIAANFSTNMSWRVAVDFVSPRLAAVCRDPENWSLISWIWKYLL